MRFSWNQLTKFFNKHETLIMINYFCGTVEWRKAYCTPSRIIYSFFSWVHLFRNIFWEFYFDELGIKNFNVKECSFSSTLKSPSACIRYNSSEQLRLTIENLHLIASRIWTNAEPEFRLWRMKLCSSDNLYTTMS